MAILSAVVCLTVILGDVLLSWVSPVPGKIMEVEDGVEMLRQSDPDILVLGSSHTRSFLPMRQMIQERSGGELEMALVPVEWGIFTSYRWVLFHRLAPLIDERRDEEAVRPSLKRALLITTFYDACKVPHIGNVNLPARAWRWSDFWSDVAQSGLTRFNRNFLQNRWKALFPGSVLVQNRGHDRVSEDLIRAVRPLSAQQEQENHQERVRWATRNMEEQFQTCWHEPELEALEDILAFFQARQIEVTVVLFPLLPEIVSQKSKETTLARYAAFAHSLEGRPYVRVVEMTHDSPMVDGDFQADFDHLTPEANPKFSRWALENKLPWLLEAP